MTDQEVNMPDQAQDSEPKKVSPTTKQLERLHRRSTTLKEVSLELRKRLSPILPPESPDKKEAGESVAPETGSSSLVLGLKDLNRGIERSINILRKLNRRIEV